MNEPLLDTDERLDLVPGTNFRLIQKIDGTAFAIDSLLLAHFVQLPATVGKVADLGSGNGIITFLLRYRKPGLQIVGVEILEEFHSLSLRNLELNRHLSGISFEHLDVRDIPAKFFPDSYDLVVSNPPYFAKGTGKIPEDPARAATRHEVAGTLKDFIESASYLLPYGGKTCMVIPANRFYEALSILKETNFGLRRLQFVKPQVGQNAHLALFEAERFYNGHHEPLPDITIRLTDGSLSEEIDQIFKAGFNQKK